MKKLILVLAILLAVPALALNLTLTQQSPDGNKIDLGYAGASASNPPRAFALNVTVTSPVTITAITNYKTGESNSTTGKGYGIYPARIAIEANGTVDSYGNPLADPNDPGTSGSGFGTQKVVLEFGSLYPAADTNNRPNTSGTLCTLTIAQNAAISTDISATEEDTYRGGVVLEDGTLPDPNLTASLHIDYGAPPLAAVIVSPASGATGILRNTSAAASCKTVMSWTAGGGSYPATSHDVSFGTANPPPFIQNQAGTTYTPVGSLLNKTKYYWRIDEKNAYGTTTGTVWNFTTLCKGDFDNSGDVTTTDLSAMINYWNANKNAFNKAPLTGGTYVVGMDLDCSGDITTTDISALINHWNGNKNAFNKAPCMP